MYIYIYIYIYTFIYLYLLNHSPLYLQGARLLDQMTAVAEAQIRADSAAASSSDSPARSRGLAAATRAEEALARIGGPTDAFQLPAWAVLGFKARRRGMPALPAPPIGAAGIYPYVACFVNILCTYPCHIQDEQAEYVTLIFVAQRQTPRPASSADRCSRYISIRSLFCEYTNLTHVRIRVICKVKT